VKVASLDVLVWLIVFVMVVLAKGWGKLQKQIDKDSSQSKEAPPVTRPKLHRPQPQMRPVAPVMRPAQPMQRTVARTAPPPAGPPAPREPWRIDPEQIRRFVEQLSGQPRPVPPPLAQPHIHKTEAIAPPPVPPTPEPAAPAPIAKHTIAEAPAPPKASRASQWAEALGDRQNIRNIIISAEIIGPPKAFS
jgi:hypothetical protein